MEKRILLNLQKELYRRYKYLNNGYFGIRVYIEDVFIVLNWSPINDKYMNYTKINQMKKFMYKYLKEHKQEGYFYVGGMAIKVDNSNRYSEGSVWGD